MINLGKNILQRIISGKLFKELLRLAPKILYRRKYTILPLIRNLTLQVHVEDSGTFYCFEMCFYTKTKPTHVYLSDASTTYSDD